MKWRSIGPYRGGRVLAVTGVPGDPYTFYFGSVAGGVWRTTDGGSNWRPLFDKGQFYRWRRRRGRFQSQCDLRGHG